MADNELTVTNGNNFSANGTNAVSHFFDTTTMSGKMALYNAMQTADKVDEQRAPGKAGTQQLKGDTGYLKAEAGANRAARHH